MASQSADLENSTGQCPSAEDDESSGALPLDMRHLPSRIRNVVGKLCEVDNDYCLVEKYNKLAISTFLLFAIRELRGAYLSSRGSCRPAPAGHTRVLTAIFRLHHTGSSWYMRGKRQQTTPGLACDCTEQMYA